MSQGERNNLEREPLSVPNDEEYFPFEVWKDGKFFKGFKTRAEAQDVCNRGNHQSGNFEVRNSDASA
jgi:hypothetical protein